MADQGSTEAMAWLGIRLNHLGGDGQGRAHPSVQLRRSAAGHRKNNPTAGSLAQYPFVSIWWAHQDLNLQPTDYESAALTN